MWQYAVQFIAQLNYIKSIIKRCGVMQYNTIKHVYFVENLYSKSVADIERKIYTFPGCS